LQAEVLNSLNRGEKDQEERSKSLPTINLKIIFCIIEKLILITVLRRGGTIFLYRRRERKSLA